MARREVVELVCDRCAKKDLQEKSDLRDEPELEVTFRGEKKVYKDLCGRCREAVKGYFMRMTKQELDQEKKPVEPPGPGTPVQLVPEDGKKRLSLFGK